VQDQRQAKPGSFIANLVGIDELIDICAVADLVDSPCPRAARSKDGRNIGGRPPYPTLTMVRLIFLQVLYNLSNDEYEYQILDRMSFQKSY
jgi:hypothetical protein